MRYEDMQTLYGLDDLGTRRKRHYLALMYRHSRSASNLRVKCPDVNLRSNNKLRFKIKTTKLTKVQKSPYYRGVSLWDHLPDEVQRATTKSLLNTFQE